MNDEVVGGETFDDVFSNFATALIRDYIVTATNALCSVSHKNYCLSDLRLV